MSSFAASGAALPEREGGGGGGGVVVECGTPRKSCTVYVFPKPVSLHPDHPEEVVRLGLYYASADKCTAPRETLCAIVQNVSRASCEMYPQQQQQAPPQHGACIHVPLVLLAYDPKRRQLDVHTPEDAVHTSTVLATGNPGAIACAMRDVYLARNGKADACEILESVESVASVAADGGAGEKQHSSPSSAASMAQALDAMTREVDMVMYQNVELPEGEARFVAALIAAAASASESDGKTA
jgi:hypothetical protein